MQRQAVTAGDGPLLVFAGAGSGKTRVLTHRIAYLVATGRARPGEILAVTFTNRAAREMRQRVEALLGADVGAMWLGTFHAIGVRILRHDGAALGIPANFVIYDETDRLAAVRRAMANLGIDERRWPPGRIVHAISMAKNELLDVIALAADARGQGPWGSVVTRTYGAYQEVLGAVGALDFDDLLLRTVQLLRDHPEVLANYQERFRYVLVDEYQDTNRAQYVMVSLLTASHGNLTVVGDDDQSVYGWRGADVRNILSFRRDYPDARVVTLEQNYRSTQNVLDAAHGVIRHNPHRAAKRLWTERGSGPRVRVIPVYDEQEEAAVVCAEIERLVGHRGYALSDCAVLYRVNAQSRAFEETMLRRGMPYRLAAGTRFYERREVKDVLAYLRLIANPRDAVAFARVVNVPRRKIGEQTLAALERLARRHGCSSLEAVDLIDGDSGIGATAAAALRRFRDLIRDLERASRRLPLSHLLEALVDATGLRTYLLDGTLQGEERWTNVGELIGLCGDYAEIPPPEGLHRFLENVALVADVDDLDADPGHRGVTLITLHQVKGLEFPVVFVTGMEEGLLPHVRSLEEGDGGVAEERRLLYVGMTRARDRLYVLHAFRRHLYGSSQPTVPSRFLADLPPEVVEVVGPGRGAVDRIPVSRTPRQAMVEQVTRPSCVAPPRQRFAEGMRVRNPRYGVGTVLKSSMTRSGEELVIRFDEHGVRIFAAADARLETIEE